MPARSADSARAYRVLRSSGDGGSAVVATSPIAQYRPGRATASSIVTSPPMLRPTTAARATPSPSSSSSTSAGVFTHRDASWRDRAAAEAPQVGRDHPEALAQRGHLRFPERPVERVAVDEDNAAAAARLVTASVTLGA
jgi:hypothetical protein